MNLYLVSRRDCAGYDGYQRMIVSAESEDEAREIHPAEENLVDPYTQWRSGEWRYDWVYYKYIENLEVERIGVSEKPRGVIMTSYYC